VDALHDVNAKGFNRGIKAGANFGASPSRARSAKPGSVCGGRVSRTRTCTVELRERILLERTQIQSDRLCRVNIKHS